MKIRDIESILKKEHSEAKVPNVYMRAKKAPINKILSPPMRVFQKKVAVRLLFGAFILLIAVVFTLVTMLSVPKQTKNELSYVSISITSGESVVRYGLFVEGTIVSLASKESEDGVAIFGSVSIVGLDVESAIQALYIAKDNDEVRFCVICDDVHSETRVSDLVSGALYVATSQHSNCTASENVADGQERQILLSLLQQKGEQTSTSLDELFDAYARAVA